MAGPDKSKRIIARKYGLLEPLNWDQDCADHLYLRKKLWNTLVEIEQDHCRAFRAIVSADESVAEMDKRIQRRKDEITEQDVLRKEARRQHRSKKGDHTKPFDVKIKQLKGLLKELYPQDKELRKKAREQAKAALAQLESQRKEAVKAAYQTSGLWWPNYNNVIDSYRSARSRAMKEGTELKFHRFDGSGSFRCQIQGGMTVEKLLSAQHNVAQVRMITHDEFSELRGGIGKKCGQTSGSRNYERGYGVLSITVYTTKGDDGKTQRRMLDFPILLHRPLPPEATLKELTVYRKRIGIDFRWDVTFTFTEKAVPVVHTNPEKKCGINLGWKTVKDGLRVATISDGENNPRHIILPQAIIDKMAYTGELQRQVDMMTNENFRWLLEQVDDQAPEPLAEAFASLKRSKRPHPGKFARTVELWQECEDYLPEVFNEADRRREVCRHRTKEYHNLRDKILRRREDFYRCRAKETAEAFGVIALDKINLRQQAALEKADGEPTELHKRARYTRTVAAVSVLREWIIKQAAKTGAVVNVVNIPSSTTCHKCGTKVKPGSGHVWTCLGCGTSWDQDDNAAINLLRAIKF